MESGPSFGMKEFLVLEPFNGELSGCLKVSGFTYSISIDSEGRNKLTDLQCETNENGLKEFSRFTISEFEVWEIIFE